MLDSYLQLNFEVIKKTDNSRFANRNDLRLTNLGPIALFRNFKMKKSSDKHLEDISHADVASSRFKKITSAKGYNNLSIGFYRDRCRGLDELSYKEVIEGICSMCSQNYAQRCFSFYRTS